MRPGPRIASRLAALGVTLAVVLSAGAARAGGMNEAPEQGAQALARGGAFVAKADDASALFHNVAGLAGQELGGTKVWLGANLQASTFTFQRAGAYSGQAGKDEAWAGRPYPLVENVGTPSPLPMLAVVSDLGSDRLGVGAGVFAPTANPGKRFPNTIGTAPSPARYDVVSGGDAKVLFPTAALAYAVSKDVRIGLAGHLVLGTFDQSSLTYFGSGDCRAEDPRCEGRARLVADGMGYGASIGALVRASDQIEIGAQVRTGATLEASGRTLVTRPNGTWMNDKPMDSTMTLELPWMARAGVRWVERERGVEVYDLELDAVYEAWGGSAGPRVVIPDMQEDKTLATGWKDTLGVRAGGAYNVALGPNVLSLRGGAYYDGSATTTATTRLDFDTLEKVGVTLGAGFRTSAVAVSFAYAATASIPRVVEDGAMRAEDSVTPDKELLAYNNGEYRGFAHTVSVSVEVSLGRLFAGSSESAPAGDTLQETSWKTPHAPSPSRRRASVSGR